MLIYVFTSLALCLISAGISCYLTVLVGRTQRRHVPVVPQTESVVPEKVESVAPATPKAGTDVDLLISSLYELTSEVNSQVSQHSLRVSEITNSLDTPGEICSAMILVAGKTLITENKKLQADLEEAKQELKQQREVIATCMQDSLTDALTNIANRRAFDRELNRMFSLRRRKKSTFSVLILDIDHFKRVNDQYGHMVGDRLLKFFSRSLTDTLRDSDFVARFGGEEFVVIIPQASLVEACKSADRIRRVIAETRHKIGDVELQVTVSIGVKEVQGSETPADLLEKVDKALYSAKNAGRNCCYYHDGAMRRRYIPVAETVAPESTSDLVEKLMTQSATELHGELHGDDLSADTNSAETTTAELVLQ